VHVRVQVPFMFKYAVDGLTMDPSGGTALGPYIALTPAALIAGYGAARAGSALCNELRNATFAKVLLTCWHDRMALL
jgi:ATP-binding cassette, subfamily B (MDR/TAP), member 7